MLDAQRKNRGGKSFAKMLINWHQYSNGSGKGKKLS
jgi:hypothetical protein